MKFSKPSGYLDAQFPFSLAMKLFPLLSLRFYLAAQEDVERWTDAKTQFVCGSSQRLCCPPTWSRVGQLACSAPRRSAEAHCLCWRAAPSVGAAGVQRRNKSQLCEHSHDVRVLTILQDSVSFSELLVPQGVSMGIWKWRRMWFGPLEGWRADGNMGAAATRTSFVTVVFCSGAFLYANRPLSQRKVANSSRKHLGLQKTGAKCPSVPPPCGLVGAEHHAMLLILFSHFSWRVLRPCGMYCFLTPSEWEGEKTAKRNREGCAGWNEELKQQFIEVSEPTSSCWAPPWSRSIDAFPAASFS